MTRQQAHGTQSRVITSVVHKVRQAMQLCDVVLPHISARQPLSFLLSHPHQTKPNRTKPNKATHQSPGMFTVRLQRDAFHLFSDNGGVCVAPSSGWCIHWCRWCVRLPDVCDPVVVVPCSLLCQVFCFFLFSNVVYLYHLTKEMSNRDDRTRMHGADLLRPPLSP